MGNSFAFSFTRLKVLLGEGYRLQRQNLLLLCPKYLTYPTQKTKTNAFMSGEEMGHVMAQNSSQYFRGLTKQLELRKPGELQNLAHLLDHNRTPLETEVGFLCMIQLTAYEMISSDTQMARNGSSRWLMTVFAQAAFSLLTFLLFSPEGESHE